MRRESSGTQPVKRRVKIRSGLGTGYPKALVRWGRHLVPNLTALTALTAIHNLAVELARCCMLLQTQQVPPEIHGIA